MQKASIEAFLYGMMPKYDWNDISEKFVNVLGAKY